MQVPRNGPLTRGPWHDAVRSTPVPAFSRHPVWRLALEMLSADVYSPVDAEHLEITKMVKFPEQAERGAEGRSMVRRVG